MCPDRTRSRIGPPGLVRCVGARDRRFERLSMLDLRCRDRQGLAADPHDQGRFQGEPGRESERELGPSPGLRGQFERPAQIFNLAGDHVHPHASAGDRVGLRLGGKTGLEEEGMKSLAAGLLVRAQPA